MLLKSQFVNSANKKEIKNYLETNDHENTATQNSLDAAKAVLRGKFTQAFLKNRKFSNNLTLLPNRIRNR